MARRKRLCAVSRTPDIGEPGHGEIVVEVLACPITPVDRSFCRDSDRIAPEFVAAAGAFGAGLICANPAPT